MASSPHVSGDLQREPEPAGKRRGGVGACARRVTRTACPEVAGVAISTPERCFYPMLGVSKLDLARYYEAVAAWMLPYVASRPLTLVRCEREARSDDALRRECTFLEHSPGWHRWAAPPLRRLRVREQRKVGEYLVADTNAALVALVQGDIIEVHCWGAQDPHLERPDRIVFDLDPGPDVPWRTVLKAAQLTRACLEALGLASWPKLTGGKGIHVVVPFRAEHSWAAVYRFAHAFAHAVAQQHPDVFTVDFASDRRAGRVLIDSKRNHRAAVAVAAYSTRAHPGGAVSMPVSWSELKPSWRSDHFTVTNSLRRLEKLGTDPWKEFWTCRQRLGHPNEG